MTTKSWKSTPKSSILKQNFRRFRNFSLTAQQPKWQNSCFKMWPIEQLYIELGLDPDLTWRVASTAHWTLCTLMLWCLVEVKIFYFYSDWLWPYCELSMCAIAAVKFLFHDHYQQHWAFVAKPKPERFFPKLNIQSNLNTDLILWCGLWIVAAVEY